MARFLLILIGIQLGCESVVDLEISGDYRSKIVVDGTFTPDSLWSIHVGKSILLYEDGADYGVVSDAIVVVSPEGGEGDTLQHVGQGHYRTMQNLRPMAGKRYNLHVSVPGLGTVEASSLTPALESELVEVWQQAPRDTVDTQQISFRIRLKNHPGKNYYNIRIDQVVPFCSCTLTQSCRCIYSSGDDDCIQDKPGNTTRYQISQFGSMPPFLRRYITDVDDPFYEPALPLGIIPFASAYFTDDSFENSILEFNIDLESYVFETIDPLFKLEISELDPEWFTYQRSLELQDSYLLGSEFFLSRPVEVYSNIQGGLGIFAGYTRHTYWFDAEGKPWEEDVIGVNSGTVQPCDTLDFSVNNRVLSFAEKMHTTEQGLECMIPRYRKHTPQGSLLSGVLISPIGHTQRRFVGHLY